MNTRSSPQVSELTRVLNDAGLLPDAAAGDAEGDDDLAEGEVSSSREAASGGGFLEVGLRTI